MRKIIKECIPYGIVNRYIEQQKIKNRPQNNVEEPLVYNGNGERMRVFYLQDTATRYAYSFTAGRDSQYIFWDRDNVLLPIHFYTHEEMFKTQNTAQKKFGLLMEPEAMIPNVYQRLYENPEIMEQFVAVFTHSAKLLEKYPNTKLYLGQGSWFGAPSGGGVLDEQAYAKKTKLVSMVSSDKKLLESHRLRISIAKSMKTNTNVDTYGAFDGGHTIKAADALTAYRFSIVLENEISPYYFTEKILNCFASMVIPIYAGAQKIGDFFNSDGIIPIDKYASIAEIERVVNQCTTELYKERLPAVIENYNKVLKMLTVDDYIFNEYKGLF